MNILRCRGFPMIPLMSSSYYYFGGSTMTAQTSKPSIAFPHYRRPEQKACFTSYSPQFSGWKLKPSKRSNSCRMRLLFALPSSCYCHVAIQGSNVITFTNFVEPCRRKSLLRLLLVVSLFFFKSMYFVSRFSFCEVLKDAKSPELSLRLWLRALDCSAAGIQPVKT